MVVMIVLFGMVGAVAQIGISINRKKFLQTILTITIFLQLVGQMEHISFHQGY